MATSIKLDDNLKARVQSLADSRERTAHWVMKKAIQDYVEREEKKVRFVEEALASWTSYKETGKHLSASEITGWLDTWGTLDEKEIPLCRD